MAEQSCMRPWPLEEILDLAKLDFGFYSRAGQHSTPGSREAWVACASEFPRNHSEVAPAGPVVIG